MTLILPKEDPDCIALRCSPVGIDEDSCGRTDGMKMNEVDRGASAWTSANNAERAQLRGVRTRFQSSELKQAGDDGPLI